MIHLATLVHDDIMDRADLRRAVIDEPQHGNSGPDAAVLLGDALFSQALHVFCRPISYHLKSAVWSQGSTRKGLFW